MSGAGPERAIDAALRLAESGDARAASAQLRALAADFPDSAEPWRLLGVLALQAGDTDAARSALEQALRRAPASPAVLCNLGALARSLGDDDEAERHYRQALARDPACVPAHNNLGGLLFDTGRLIEAERHYRAALASAPAYAPARGNLAACLLALDRGREALAEAERTTRDAPGHAPAWLALGQARLALAANEEAGMAFAHALALGLRTPEALYGQAQSLDELGRWPEALLACEQALALDEAHAPAASLAQYLRRRLCRHEGLAQGRQRLLDLLEAGVEGVAPFAFLSEEASPAAQRRAAEIAAASVQRRVDARHVSDAAPGFRVAPNNERVRVGFVSSGFGQHPTALLIVDVVERLRGGAIEAFGYATTPDDGGPLRRRLSNGFAGLRDLSGLSHGEMARRIRADACEVLIDLRGWGGGSVAEVFAQRPAPVQVNWLAYPGTSGAPWIDYLIADRCVVPDAERAHYSEAVLRLPHCFQPSDGTRTIGEPPARAALGLPDAAVVFACFNNSYKYSPESVARFWRVLRDVPDGVLWLLDGKQSEIAGNLRASAQDAGIEPQRLLFLPKQPHERYLACYRHADLFLDTTPYNAHTTASDALWAGCPVLTVPGRTFAARVAGSLNVTLGLHDLNATDDEAFVATAIALGRDPDARRALRERLARARSQSPLFDMGLFAHHFERALVAIADRHRRRLPPADVDLE